MSKKKKQPTVTCQDCGVENPIHAVFCKGCGGRLYKGGAGPDASAEPRRVSKLRAVRNFISSLLLLVILVACGLALWPFSPSSFPASSAPGTQLKNYLDRAQTAQATGAGLEDLKLSQSSLNGFLGQHAEPDQHKRLGATLSEQQILILASERLGPLAVSSRLELQPAEGTSSTFVPTALFVGQLPLPLECVPFWTERMIRLFDLDVDPDTLKGLRIRRAFENGMVIGAAPLQ